MGDPPHDFEYRVLGDGSVRITRHGAVAATLRGRRATDFLDDVGSGDAQQLMARITGNYRRGNERTAKRHPRNR